jgi:hypothetical protein
MSAVGRVAGYDDEDAHDEKERGVGLELRRDLDADVRLWWGLLLEARTGE